MGYRSEVCIRIKQSKVTDEFKEEIKKGFMPVDYTDGDEWFELYGDYWKWYEDEYDEVKHVMNYLKKLSGIYFTISSPTMRIMDTSG